MGMFDDFSMREKDEAYELNSLDAVVKHLVEWVIKSREQDLEHNKTVSGTKEELEIWLVNEDECNAEIRLAKELIGYINPEHEILEEKFVITIHPCEVCENTSVEYVNGESCGCEVCHEGYMNRE